jgi:hypothetical protein
LEKVSIIYFNFFHEAHPIELIVENIKYLSQLIFKLTQLRNNQETKHLRGLPASTISLRIQPSDEGNFDQNPEPWWSPHRGGVSLEKHRAARQRMEPSWNFLSNLCST